MNTRIIDSLRKIMGNYKKEPIEPLEYSCRLTESVDEDIALIMVCRREPTIIYSEFYKGGEVGIIAENAKKKETIYNADISIGQLISTINTIFDGEDKKNG